MVEPKSPDAQPQAGFLGRWSRRKAQAREGVPPAEPAAPCPDAASATAVCAAEPPAESRALPSLADIQALTAESDFVPFMARGVAPGVRNAAMKKLFFADPHFNVMDGLDIYIDDYSKPAPLSAAMLKRMASAKFLGLVDDDEAGEQDDEYPMRVAEPAPGLQSPPVAAVPAEPLAGVASSVGSAEGALPPDASETNPSRPS